MRILYFTRDYTPHDFRFLSSLAETEHEVFSLRLEHLSRQVEDRPLPPKVQQVQWRGGRVPFEWNQIPALSLALRGVLQRIKPDVVHAGPVPNVAFLAALSGAKPLVSMSWGSDLMHDVDFDRWQRWAARYALWRSQAMVGDCQAVKDKAVSLGFKAEKVRLFPWGIDLEKFGPGKNEDFRERRGWQDAFVLLSLRSWEPIYGIDVVVKAFTQASKRIPELRLILLGSGSQGGLIRSLIIVNHLEDRVFLGGQVKYADLPRYYQAADLYLSASHSDGSSVSLMEALASGLPALVSDIPGNKEWVTPGCEGWLFKDGDAEGMAQAILKAYEQRKQFPEMARAARKLAEARADWKKNFRVLLEAYRAAIDAAKRPSKRSQP